MAGRKSLTIDEAAALAGVSRGTVLRRIQSGEIPVKRGARGKVSIDPRDVDALRSKAPEVDNVVLLDHHSNAESFHVRTFELNAARIADEAWRPRLVAAVESVERVTRPWPALIAERAKLRPAEDWRYIDDLGGAKRWWIVLDLLTFDPTNHMNLEGPPFTDALVAFRAALAAPSDPEPLAIPATVEAARALVRERRAAFRRARVALRRARKRGDLLAGFDEAVARWNPSWRAWSRGELSDLVDAGAPAEAIRLRAEERRRVAIRDIETLAGLLGPSELLEDERTLESAAEPAAERE